MLQLYTGNPRVMTARPSSQMIAVINPVKVRSMSSNKLAGAITPRSSGQKGFADDMMNVASPFAMMQQVSSMQNQLMKGFDNMFNMAFGGFSGTMNFDNVGQAQAGKGTAGKVITRTYVTHTGLGPDGKPYKEQYFSHNYAARGTDGTTVSEKQQGYQHSGTTLQQIALEKSLNNKGRKMVKERIKGTGEERTHNFYYGIDQGEGDAFERQWMKASEEIGFMHDFGKKLGYQNYKNKQINDPSFQQRSNSRPQPQPRKKGNDANAERWGLEYGEGSQTPQSTRTLRHYTNDDVYIPVNGTPRVARTRPTDIMPTIPGRGITIGGGAPVNRRPSTRAETVRNVEPTIHAEPIHLAEPTAHNNTNIGDFPRNNPVRAFNNVRVNQSGSDSHGNFRNKNPQNVMPKAG